MTKKQLLKKLTTLQSQSMTLNAELNNLYDDLNEEGLTPSAIATKVGTAIRLSDTLIYQIGEAGFAADTTLR